MGYIVYSTADDDKNRIISVHATSALATTKAATDSEYAAWADAIDDDDLIENKAGSGEWGWVEIVGQDIALKPEAPFGDNTQRDLDLRRGHQVYLDYRNNCRQTIWQSLGTVAAIGADNPDTFASLDGVRAQEESLLATDRWVMHQLAIWDWVARDGWPSGGFTGTDTKEKLFQHIEKWCADPANVYIWYKVVKAQDAQDGEINRRRWASEPLVDIWSDIITTTGGLIDPDATWKADILNAHANFDPEEPTLRRTV